MFYWIRTKLKGWKTILFNAVSFVVLVAGSILQYVDQLGLSDKDAAMAAMIASFIVTAGNAWLRSITTTAMGQK